VRLIRNDRNLGFAKANNIGISHCNGRYICLMNSDIKVIGECLSELVKYMDLNRGIGMVGPKILWPNMTLQSSCRQFPTLWNNFCAFFWLSRLWPRSKLFAGEHMFFFAHDEIKKVDVLVGCLVVARREAIEQVGLLDEEFFMYAEDVDWCRRFWKMGWEVVFFPHACAIHNARSSSCNAPVRFAIEQQRSILIYWRKYHAAAARLIFLLLNVAHELLRLFVGVIAYLARPSIRNKSGTQVAAAAGCLRMIIHECVFARESGIK
jgi:GT2 family glycosyltransferase